MAQEPLKPTSQFGGATFRSYANTVETPTMGRQFVATRFDNQSDGMRVATFDTCAAAMLFLHKRSNRGDRSRIVLMDLTNGTANVMTLDDIAREGSARVLTHHWVDGDGYMVRTKERKLFRSENDSNVRLESTIHTRFDLRHG